MIGDREIYPFSFYLAKRGKIKAGRQRLRAPQPANKNGHTNFIDEKP